MRKRGTGKGHVIYTQNKLEQAKEYNETTKRRQPASQPARSRNKRLSDDWNKSI